MSTDKKGIITIGDLVKALIEPKERSWEEMVSLQNPNESTFDTLPIDEVEEGVLGIVLRWNPDSELLRHTLANNPDLKPSPRDIPTENVSIKVEGGNVTLRDLIIATIEKHIPLNAIVDVNQYQSYDHWLGTTNKSGEKVIFRIPPYK